MTQALVISLRILSNNSISSFEVALFLGDIYARATTEGVDERMEYMS